MSRREWTGQATAAGWRTSAITAHEHRVLPGRVMLGLDGPARPLVLLEREAARGLGDWLLHVAGDRPEPADPDAVLASIDDQRRELAARSAAPETTEEARTELAWASRALDAIAAAADGAR